jgi:uncharacterized protein (TIGR02453 family)
VRVRTAPREPLDAAVALRFLRQLKAHNDRTWFAAHRAVYDDTIKPGFEDLVTGLIAAATAFDERFAGADPRAMLFRLARDTRFSADKTPYKSVVSAFLSPFGKSGTNAGFYVQLSPGESMFAAGIYTPEKPALLALRQHFAAGARDFERVLRAKRFAPYLPLDTDPLKRVPRGFPPDHPRADLLRARNYMVHRTYPDATIVRDGPFATFRDAMRDCAPFVAYLDAIASSVSMRDFSDG